MLHVNFLTLLRVLEVNIDLRHVNHIRYYYYYYYYYFGTLPVLPDTHNSLMVPINIFINIQNLKQIFSS